MPSSDWAPSVDAVGALLRARTKDMNGNELGTFTAATRPTAEQVGTLIAQSVGDLADSIPVDVPERLWPSATRVAALEAALAIELSYWPEQVATGRSPYTQLKDLYDERLAAFLRALANEGLVTDADTGSGDGGMAVAEPTWAFPTQTIIGWRGGPW